MFCVSLKEGKLTLLLPWLTTLSSTKANTCPRAELPGVNCQQMILTCSWEAELTLEDRLLPESPPQAENRLRADS